MPAIDTIEKLIADDEARKTELGAPIWIKTDGMTLSLVLALLGCKPDTGFWLAWGDCEKAGAFDRCANIGQRLAAYCDHITRRIARAA